MSDPTPRMITIDLDARLREATRLELQARTYDVEAARLRGQAAGIRETVQAVLDQINGAQAGAPNGQEP